MYVSKIQKKKIRTFGFIPLISPLKSFIPRNKVSSLELMNVKAKKLK